MFEKWLSSHKSSLPPTWETLVGVLGNFCPPLAMEIVNFFNKMTPGNIPSLAASLVCNYQILYTYNLLCLKIHFPTLQGLQQKPKKDRTRPLSTEKREQQTKPDCREVEIQTSPDCQDTGTQVTPDSREEDMEANPDDKEITVQTSPEPVGKQLNYVDIFLQVTISPCILEFQDNLTVS